MAILKNLIVNGVTRVIGDLTASKIIKQGGVSSLFLKADGSVDSTSYYHSGNKPSLSDLGAAAASHIHTNYVTKDTNLVINSYKTFLIDAPLNDRETVYYNIGLHLSSYGDDHKKIAAIGMGNEYLSNYWYKAAIGFERTGSYDRGDIVFLFNNAINSTSCTYSDIKVRINPDGNINTLGSIYANGFIKTNSTNSYILLGGGGHKAISDFATAGHTHSYLPLSGGDMSGDNRWIGSTMGGGDDYWRIGGRGSGDSGTCVITIGDNYNDKFAIEIADYQGTTYRPLEATYTGINTSNIYVAGTYRQLYSSSTNGNVIHSILNYSASPYGLLTRIYNNGCVSLQSQRETTSSEYFNLSLNPLGGKVGIGTTDPSMKLHVAGNVFVNPYIYYTSSNYYSGYYSSGKYLELFNDVGNVGIHLFDNGTIKTYKNGVRYEIIDSGNISSQSVSYANSAESAIYLTPQSYTAINNTVGGHKAGLVNWLNNDSSTGIGKHVIVGASIINQWDNDSATYYDSSVYAMIKIGGGYNYSTYGLWLLSSYNQTRLGVVGRNSNTWSSIKWIAWTSDIPTKVSQLTNDSGYLTSLPSHNHDDRYVNITGDTMTGNLSFSNSGTEFRGINYGTMGDNDQWRIGGAATGSNSGYMEIATADDGTEPIYVRQYTGVFSSLTRTLALLDSSGNTTIPGKVGIGTTSPRSKLDVYGTEAAVIIGKTNSSPGNSSARKMRLGLATAGHTGSEYWTFCIDDTTSNSYMQIGYDKDSVGISIRHDGCLGIGNNYPSYKLHVEGDIYTTTGFKKNGSNDNYVLLGGGGHKLISDFATSGHTHSYLPLSGGNIGSANKVSFSTHGLPIVGTYTGNAGTMTISSNGIAMWGSDAISDGAAIYLEHAGSDVNNLIFEIGDNAIGASSDKIKFRYHHYDNTIYEIVMPVKSGIVALLSDIPTSLPANGGTSDYAKYLRGRQSDGTYYGSEAGNNIIAEWNTKSDNRWYLKAASSYECRVDYATSAGTSSYVTVSTNTSSSSRKILFHDGNAIYSNTTLTVVPYTGNVTSSGHFYANSDIRYKNIIEYSYSLSNKIAQLPIIKYKWIDRDDDSIRIGSSALSVMGIMPELVTYDDKTDFYSLDYATLGAVAGISACKEVETLKLRIQDLEQEIIFLKSKYNG